MPQSSRVSVQTQFDLLKWRCWALDKSICWYSFLSNWFTLLVVQSFHHMSIALSAEKSLSGGPSKLISRIFPLLFCLFLIFFYSFNFLFLFELSASLKCFHTRSTGCKFKCHNKIICTNKWYPAECTVTNQSFPRGACVYVYAIVRISKYGVCFFTLYAWTAPLDNVFINLSIFHTAFPYNCQL